MPTHYLRFIQIILITVLVITACTSGENGPAIIEKTTVNGQSLTEINIDAISSEVTKIGLSEFFADMNVTRLESSEEALAVNAKLTFADDFLLLATQQSQGAAKILRFDREGTFLNDIGKEGDGPGEHRGYLVNTLKYYKDDNSVLVDWGGSRLQLFRPDGNHVKDIKMPLRLLENINRRAKDEWFSFGSTTGRTQYLRDSVKVVFYTSDGEITKRIKRTNYPPKNTREYTPSGSASLFSYNGTKKIYFPGDHTIYRIEDREMIPEAIIRPGEKGLPYNELTDPDNIVGSHRLEILSETERNWFIKKSIYLEADFNEFKNEPGRWGGRFDIKEQLIVIDKETKKGKIYTFTDDLLFMLPEQAFKSLPSWQEGFGVHFALSPDIYLRLQEESDTIDQRSPEIAQKLEVLDGITKNDNFIIITLKFRDEIVID